MAAAMKLSGVALVWCGLAALVYVPTAVAGPLTTAVAVVGFLAFAAGALMFGDALKREIAVQMERQRRY